MKGSKDSAEQSQSRVEQLKQKLIGTSQQVQEIVNSFQGVHQELVDLKQEFLQQQQQVTPAADDDKDTSDDSESTPGKQDKLQLSGFINLR